MPPKREILLYAGMTRLQRTYYSLLEAGKLRDALMEANVEGAKEISEVMCDMISLCETVCVSVYAEMRSVCRGGFRATFKK